MWIIFAVLSALFAGITAVLSKAGIKKVNSALSCLLAERCCYLFKNFQPIRNFCV